MKTFRAMAAVEGLSDHMLPRRCVLCGLQLSAGHFCKGCLSELPWIAAACEHCGQPLEVSLPEGAFCVACQLHPAGFDKAFAPLLYSFPVDTALKALKFTKQLCYAPAFGGLLVPLQRKLFPDVDTLVPVPLHRRRHAARGFNQAAELCRPLLKASGLPLIHNVRRIRATKSQTGLDASARRHNMKAAFEVRGTLRCRHPLVIDDVITTGETCRQVADTLIRAGAERVSILAVARAISP